MADHEAMLGLISRSSCSGNATAERSCMYDVYTEFLLNVRHRWL